VTGRVWAVIPVKRFAAAKTRLSPVLDADERAKLARLMFEDVIEAVTACSDVFDGTSVITIDPEAAALARKRDAFVLGDVSERGVNDALSRCLRYLEATADGVIVVPSDIPHIARPALVESAAAIAMGPAVALVCAADDCGTNLFASRPLGVIKPEFGPRSFEQHRRAALQAGVAVRTLHLPGLSLDIDRPEDLCRFLALGSNTRTHDFLSSIPLIERIERRVAVATGAPS
jgi:2-phospho-L-lactate guanylyltransferase